MMRYEHCFSMWQRLFFTLSSFLVENKIGKTEQVRDEGRKKPGLRRKRNRQVEGEARGEGEPARGKRL